MKIPFRWPRRFRSLLALAALVAAAALPGAAAAIQGAASVSQPVTIQVPANAQWVDSGIALTAGAPVNVTATGIVDCGGRGCASDPNGVQPDTGQQWGADSAGFLVPGAPQASLFAKVGDGAPVFVGRGPTTVGGTGRLYFAYNDSYYPDNHGAYTVTISPLTAGANPNSCLAIRNANPSAGDGQYAVRVNGREIPVYCYGMASGAPREYLSLPNRDGGYNTSYTPGMVGSATARTAYARVGIDTVGLKLNLSDPTFATTTFTPSGATSFTWTAGVPQTFVPYATAQDCQAGGSRQGTANVNLRSTPFGMVNTFLVQGWIANGTISLTDANQIANLTGGGWCGATAPAGRVYGITVSELAGFNLGLTWLGPTVTAQPSAQPNHGAWYNSAGPDSVTISFQCAASAAFPLSTCPAPVTVSSEGANQTVTGLAAGTDGTKAYATISGINIDKTAPVTTISGVPTGWTNQPVALTLTGTDNLSGVAATYYSLDGAAAQTGTTLTVTADGPHSVTYWSVDVAGNEESHQTATVQIDRTPPTITGSASGTASAGWYKADVTVSFACSDATSGIATCSGPTVLQQDGQGQSVTGTATDDAGNSAQATVSGINIDRTAPTIDIGFAGETRDGAYVNTVTPTITAHDGLSGIDPAQTVITLNGSPFTSGTAVTAPGSYTLAVAIADVAGNPAATTVQFKVRHTTALTYTGAQAGDYDDAATFAAVLTDNAAAPAPLGGQNVSFTLGAQSCPATTDGSGQATCRITPNVAAGTYPLGVSFAGNDLYYGSSAAGSFTVGQEQTALRITSSATLDTNRVTMTAQLQEDGATPIAGRTVTFTATGLDGTFTATGVTDAAGTATATLAVAPDQYSLSAAFAGDGYYMGAADQQTLYVYQPTQFVIWGGNPGGVQIGADYNFWGAQWMKQVGGKNQVTASFKGYADQVTGATWIWSTSPGNSSKPPATLPRYISVLVSNQIAKSGNNITGNVVKIVVLRVDSTPTYSPDPSTPGCGVMMAIVQ